jgi:serine/threonine protein kinase
MPVTQPEKLTHFHILETLGSGGNGTVYRAVDTRNNQIVALKTLKQVSDATLARFKREFLSLKKMENPGIVSVYEGFFDHDPPFFSMEWVRGKTLSQVIQDMENNPLIFTVADRENFALRLSHRVCEILAYIHAFDEVHRDLKPDNIFITLESGNILSDFQVKMLDFGLLKGVNDKDADATQDEDSQGGMIVGTVHYLSPEQAKSGDLDPRSDLFSLGVIIYKIVSLKLPYEANDVVGYIFKTVFEDPIPIEQHNPNVSPEIRSLLQDLLAKEPSKRPPTSKSLAKRIKTILEGPVAQKDIDLSDFDFTSGFEGFGSPLLPPPLIGRDNAIKTLETVVQTIEDGTPRAVILSGESGMGRTAVLREWKSHMQFVNPIFLQADFSGEAIPTQDPIGTMMDGMIRNMKPEDIKRTFRDVYPFLSSISRYLGRYFDTKSVGRFDHLSPSRKLQVLAVNFIKLIGNLAESGPVIMVLEDVENAPERFLGWLTLLWEQLGQKRFLLVFSCSPEINRPAYSQMLGRLRDQPETALVELKALSEAEVQSLLQAMLPISRDLPFSGKLARLIQERAHGNPFYSIELFSRLYEEDHLYIDRGQLQIKSVDDVDVPLSIHQALLKKVQRLPKESFQYLRQAAIFGQSFSYNAFKAALDLPEERFLEHLNLIIKLGIMSEESEPQHKLHFNAPALQKLISEETPVEVQRELHNKAARALELSEESSDPIIAEQIALHYADAANYVRAIKYTYLAGNMALDAKEVDKAIYFYELSLRMMDKMENRQARNLVNLKLAEVYLSNDNPTNALNYYNASLKLRNLSKMEELRSLRGRMLCYRRLNKLKEAAKDASALYALGQSCSSRIKAESTLARGEMAWLAEGQAQQFFEDVEKASSDYPKLARWRSLYAFGLLISNQVQKAQAYANTMLKNKQDSPLAAHIVAASSLYFSGHLKESAEHLKTSQVTAPELQAHLPPTLMVIQALLTYKIKATLAPDHSADEYITIANRYIERFDLQSNLIYIDIVKLEHLLMNGRYPAAWEMVRELVERSPELPHSHLERYLFLSLVMRAAWESAERPPRGWLMQFQKFEPAEDACFILTTHWALAKAAEAVLPLSMNGAVALKALKVAEKVLVKNKLRYYYRAVLKKQIKVLSHIGQVEPLEKLEALRKRLDQSLGFHQPRD